MERYYSDEFGQKLIVEKRMSKTARIHVIDDVGGGRFHRWTLNNLDAYLKAGGFSPAPRPSGSGGQNQQTKEKTK